MSISLLWRYPNLLHMSLSLGHDHILRALGLHNRPLLQKVRFDWEGGGDADDPPEESGQSLHIILPQFFATHLYTQLHPNLWFGQFLTFS